MGADRVHGFQPRIPPAIKCGDSEMVCEEEGSSIRPRQGRPSHWWHHGAPDYDHATLHIRMENELYYSRHYNIGPVYH